jgi:hypothetical protein
MALFDRFLARQVKTGELTLIHADGTTKHFGKPDPAYNPVTIRLTQPGVAGAIVRHPALGAASPCSRATARGSVAAGSIRRCRSSCSTRSSTASTA